MEDAPSQGLLAGHHAQAATPSLGLAETQALLAEALAQQQALRLENQELQAARQELAASEARLKAAEAVAGLGSYELDLVSGTLHFSEGLYRLFGEAPSSPPVSIAWIDARSNPEDAVMVHEVLARAQHNKQPYLYTRRVRRADGQWRTFASHGRVVCDAAGTAIRLEGVVEDKTESYQAEQELLTAKERLQITLDSSLYIVQAFEAVRDETGRIVDFTWIFANKTWKDQYGEPEGKSMLTENPGVLANGLFEKFVQVTETGVPIDHEQFYDREQFDGWFHQTLVKMGDGFVMHTEDINARKQAEQEIQASRELLRATIDSSLAMVQVFEAVRNEQGEIIDFTWILNNQVSGKRYGNVIGKRLLLQNPGVVEAGIFNTFKQVVETGQPDQSEWHYMQEQFDGWFHQSTVKLHDGVATTTYDISERKRNEQEILHLKDAITQQAEDKYRTLFDSIDEAFVLIELLFDGAGRPADYRFLETNQVYERQTGSGDVVGKRALELDPHLEVYWLETYGQVALTGEPVRLENYHELSGRWYSAYASRVGGVGSPLVALVFDDITERKHQEQRQAFLLKLSDVLRPLSKAFDIQRAALHVVGEELDLDWVLYNEIDPDATTHTIQTCYVREGLVAHGGPLPTGSLTKPIRALRHDKTDVIYEVETDERFSPAEKAIYASIGVQALAVVPLIKNGQWVVNLVAYSSKPRQWPPQEVALLEEAAERTWVAVERARAEDARRRSEERLRVAIDAAELGTWDWDLATNEVRWNARHYALLGLKPTPGPLTPDDFACYVHTDDRPEVMRHLQAAVDDNQLFEAEFRVLTAQDELRWLSSHGQATDIAPDGRVGRMSGVILDVTERKHAEQHLQALAASLERKVQQRTRALREGRDLLQSVYDTTLVGMTVLHAVRDATTGAIEDFIFVSVNKELARLTGRSDLVGRRYVQEFPGMVPSGMFALLVRAVETGQPQQSEFFYPYENVNRWLSSMHVKLDDGVVTTILDITERKLAEQELLKSLRLLEQSEQVAELGSWVYELATRELRWSAGMYRFFGLAPGTPVRPNIYLDHVVAADRPAAERVVRALTKTPADLEETLRLRVGTEERTMRLKAAVVRDDAGQPVRLLGVDLDMSQVQRLEADNLRLRLRQQQALFEAVQEAQEEERRRMSESLHNGIGQLLYATKLQLDCLPTTPELPARRAAARLLSEAIQQTRTLSHELTPAILEEFGLEATLQSICHSLNTPTLRWHCHLVLEQEPPLPVSLQLAVYRLAQELVQNVLKHAQATEATLEVEVLPAWVVLRVEDNGRGFDPTHTTDGLGLRTLRSRVALLGGSVYLTTAPGQGAQCQVRIPLTFSYV
jgi:PAS domain S-box-containing protein